MSSNINRIIEKRLNTVSQTVNRLDYIQDLLIIKKEFDNINDNNVNKIIVNNIYDLPLPINNVITLKEGKTYFIATHIDLLGARLETNGIVNLFGLSSETSSITSTGLNPSTPLITSEYTIVIENITIKNVGTALNIDGNSRIVALDWENVNFENVPNVGVINTCDNFIFETSAFLGAQGLRFTGTIGTIAINNSLLRGLNESGNIIEVDTNCNVTRRFRVIYSSIISPALSTGINVNVNATIPTESYILDTVNFSGAGTFILGIDDTSNKALFTNCTGIKNTAVNGQLYTQNNVTATVISNTDLFYKIAGTTIPSIDNSKFIHSDNRLTCDAVISRKYLIQATLSFTTSGNNICEFGFYDSQLNAIRTPSRTKATANTGGRAENVHLFCVRDMKQNDYIEVWCRNTSGLNNITVDQLNFTITEIK